MNESVRRSPYVRYDIAMKWLITVMVSVLLLVGCGADTPTLVVDTPKFARGEAGALAQTWLSNSDCRMLKMSFLQQGRRLDRWTERYVGNGKWEVKASAPRGWVAEWEVIEHSLSVRLVSHTWTSIPSTPC